MLDYKNFFKKFKGAESPKRQPLQTEIIDFLKSNGINKWGDWLEMSQFQKWSTDSLIDSYKNPDWIRFLIRLELSNQEELGDYLKELEEDEEYEKCQIVLSKIKGSGINESILYYTPKFRKKLEEISKIDTTGYAQKILDVEGTNPDVDMTLIDYVGGGSQDISFVQMSRVSPKFKGEFDIDIESGHLGDRVDQIWEENPLNPIFIQSRNTTGLGRFLGRIFVDDRDPIQVEKFINLWKSSTLDANFKVIKGDDIIRGYSSEFYSRGGGSLGGSCMNDEEDLLVLYQKNPNMVNLLVLEDSEGILGRALLWKVDHPEFTHLMDRIYSVEISIETKFIEWAKEKGWAWKTRQSTSEYISWGNKSSQYPKLSLKIENIVDKWPYLDTFQYLDMRGGILTNWDSENSTHMLDQTNGRAREYRVWSNFNGALIDKGDAIWVADRGDWYKWGSQAIVLRGKAYLIGEDVVRTKWNHGYCLKEDAVWSETKNSWVDREKSKNVILQNGETDWIPTNYLGVLFYEWKDKYYHVSLCVKDLIWGYRGYNVYCPRDISIPVKIHKLENLNIVVNKGIWELIRHLYKKFYETELPNWEEGGGEDMWVGNEDRIINYMIVGSTRLIIRRWLDDMEGISDPKILELYKRIKEQI
jgi:hypothetical protein